MKCPTCGVDGSALRAFAYRLAEMSGASVDEAVAALSESRSDMTDDDWARADLRSVMTWFPEALKFHRKPPVHTSKA